MQTHQLDYHLTLHGKNVKHIYMTERNDSQPAINPAQEFTNRWGSSKYGMSVHLGKTIHFIVLPKEINSDLFADGSIVRDGDMLLVSDSRVTNQLPPVPMTVR
jgi:hypothetical protein